jgi:hypothetical protein
MFSMSRIYTRLSSLYPKFFYSIENLGAPTLRGDVANRRKIFQIRVGLSINRLAKNLLFAGKNERRNFSKKLVSTAFDTAR